MHAYGRLKRTELAPDADPDEALAKVLFATVMWHVTEMSPNAVANVAWSLAWQGLGFRNTLQPLR